MVVASHYLQLVGRGLDGDGGVLVETLAASVNGEHEVVAAAVNAELYLDAVVEDDGAHGETVCCDGGEDYRLGVGRDDGASYAEGVAGGAGGGADDETISEIGGEVVAVNGGVDADHRRVVVLEDGYLVEGVGTLQISARGGHLVHLEQRTLFYLVVALGDVAEYVVGILWQYVADETEAPGVDAYDGHAAVAHKLCRAEEGAVTAYADGEVCGDVLMGCLLKGDATDIDMAAQELRKVLLNDDTAASGSDALQHLLDVGGLLCLEFVAEDGKCFV